ncbi:hypothetical protein RUM44_009431 [Polyplax serrata]|uniref:Exonuclease domain-containing protein n=1 Tax=Polyplax serrata TaxID=468196 RepID=A0ABR1ASN6_POLSC
MWGLIRTSLYLFSKDAYSVRLNSAKAAMVTFNSIIVFDTETTGLPHLENNNTRITEMALMGCEIEHLKNSTDIPRVLHKLVFCFNPMKMITPDSTKVSGLENEMLMNIKPFTATDAEMLNHFIDRLPSPVCIVAHNGYKFDFPILQKHLHQLNITLPDSVYCADSLKAFQEIFPNSRQSQWQNKNSNQPSEKGDVTPEKATTSSSSTLNATYQNWASFKSKRNSQKVCRQLFKDKSPPSISSQKMELSQLSTQMLTSSPVRYTLSTIYEFLHGNCYPGGHRAEEDAKALLRCIIKCDKFLSWMNDKAVAFNTIKPLL